MIAGIPGARPVGDKPMISRATSRRSGSDVPSIRLDQSAPVSFGLPAHAPAADSCHSCAVRQRAGCGVLNADEISKLYAISHTKTLEPGQCVLSESELVHVYGNVISGVIKLTKTLSNGRQQIVGLQFPSDFLGRPWRQSCPYDAVAVTQVMLCTFERSKFEALVRECPKLEHRMFEYALDDLDAAQEWLLLLGRKTAGEKVASLIRLFSRRLAVAAGGERSGGSLDSFDLPLTRAEMADFLGLTIETVSRQLTKLKLAGVIALDGGRRIHIPDLDRLEMACEAAD
jgi:CRP/FNR family transcriptional regulator